MRDRFVDDYRKLILANSKGLAPRVKLGWQIAVGLAPGCSCIRSTTSHAAVLPFFKNLQVDLGWWYVPFAAVFIAGFSNAVNLTDGLDGLAIGPVMTTTLTYGIFAYATDTCASRSTCRSRTCRGR